MTERDQLVRSLCDLTADYRSGEIDPPTPDDINKWVNQFDSSVQLPVLTEIEHVLQQTYFSKNRVKSFLASVLDPCQFNQNDPVRFWKETGILDIQQQGESQRDLLSTLEGLLKEKHGFSFSECSPVSGRFIYLDDGLFSGFHALNDLVHWLPQAPPSCRVIILSIAQHAGSVPFIRPRITAAASGIGKQTTLELWRCLEMENRRSYRNQSDVLWPCRLPEDPEVSAYVQSLTAAGYPPVLRTAGTGGLRFFSSEQGRDLLEQEFLKAGVRIRQNCPNLNEYQRPLGNSVLRTLGFGSLFVTHRNCPNNNPLALWAGDPWYPLFRRRTN